MVRTAVIALVLVACGGNGSKSSTMATSEGPTCAAVADSMVAMMAEGKESTKAFVDAKEGFVEIIRTRCTDDAWTAEAKDCLATMKSREDAERCSTLLTEEQQANLVRDQKAKFGAEPAPEPASAAPPPAPVEAEKPAEKSRAVPKGTKPKKPGDPCDGGE